MIQALDAIETEENYFEGYYSGKLRGVESGVIEFQENEYLMSYKDVSYKGDRYRGVQIKSYRPSYTNDFYGYEEYSYQDENGYSCRKYYWFKYEPLKWYIFDSNKGLALCESVIDAQPFNSTYITVDGEYFKQYYATYPVYANAYSESSLREWLNSTFTNTAFTEEEQALLPITNVDTRYEDGSCGQYRSPVAEDRVVLLTYDQAKGDNIEGSSFITVKDDFASQ